ncbi:hypothetical protein ANCDUO_09104 [Ancylostoma duodenale]|uniref:Sulfatase N-terminal domain-containing protein n=1 Tax=Ancylostoma duodenale TaxID=51022 RepID=A0A0C2DDV2_9BILA|nr:hypothetical protein ANCDUO_09104 [Ancylostoma duodenale]
MEPSGVPLLFPFVSENLRSLGYSTYLIGKWHLGYCRKEFLPTSRGFDYFYGFYGPQAGYFNHSSGFSKMFCLLPPSESLTTLMLVYAEPQSNNFVGGAHLEERRNTQEPEIFANQLIYHLMADRSPNTLVTLVHCC